MMMINYLDDVISCVGKTASGLFNWFSNNGIKAISDKCPISLSTKQKPIAKISNCEITYSKKRKAFRCNF